MPATRLAGFSGIVAERATAENSSTRTAVAADNRGMPDPTNVRELLPHLIYEIKMLLMTDLLLLREQKTPRNPDHFEDWTIHNALFEAHTIHARALYSFFFQGRGKPADAVAGDYVLNWHLLRPAAAPVLKTVSPRVGREIAHLTYGRLAYKTDEERKWAFTDITRALVAVINLWLTHAPQHVRDALIGSLSDYAAQSEVLGSPHRSTSDD
jgi:hypothetical protein